jgi:HEAT repeat protein
MVQGPRVFKPITGKKPFYKNPGAIAASVVVLAVAALAAFVFKADESTLLKRVQAHDALSAPAGYALGFRGVKLDATRDALETELENSKSDKPTPEDVRRAAAYALGSVKNYQVVQHLVEGARNDPSPLVRATACRALGRTDEHGGVDALIAALDDGEASVRIGACNGCGTLRDNKPIDKLIERVSDPVYEVRRAAQHALTAITNQDFDIDPAAWRRWHEK